MGSKAKFRRVFVAVIAWILLVLYIEATEFLERLTPVDTSGELRLVHPRRHEAIMPDHGGDAEPRDSTVRQAREIRQATPYGMVG